MHFSFLWFLGLQSNYYLTSSPSSSMDKHMVHFSSTSVSSSSPIFNCRGFLCSWVTLQRDRNVGSKKRGEKSKRSTDFCLICHTFLYLCGKVNLSMVVWTAPLLTLPSRSSSCSSSCRNSPVNKMNQNAKKRKSYYMDNKWFGSLLFSWSGKNEKNLHMKLILIKS